MKKRPTIHTVAEAAGVSVSTVSRVINGSARVDAAKVKIVQDAVERLGYRPDTVARDLSSKKSAIIGLNGGGSNLLNPYSILFREMFHAKLQDHHLRLEHTPSVQGQLPEYMGDIAVLMELQENDTRIAQCNKNKLPFVVIGHAEGERGVAPNDFDGGRQAAKHLVELGHSAFLFLGNSVDENAIWSSASHNEFVQQRLRGFISQLRLADITLDDSRIINSGPSSLDAFLAIRDVIRKGVTFTAIFAISDELAVGAIKALEDAGLTVPQDVSVIGFDDFMGAGQNLTTVHQEIGEVADAAATLVKEALAGEPIRHIEIPVRLIIRASTAEAKKPS